MLERSRIVDDLVTKLKGLRRDHYEYLEVKQLAEILARHRAKARLALKDYRDLKRAVATETDPMEKLYLGYEGMFLRDHLRDALRLYMLVNHDYHEAFRIYMDALKSEKFSTDLPLADIIPAKKLVLSNPAINMSQPRRSAA